MWTLGGCLNKWLFCWKDLWIPISRQMLTRQEGPEQVVSELRPPAIIVLHIHRCIGRKQQLHHRCFTIGCCPVQWGVASAQRQHTVRAGSEAAVFFEKFHQGQGPFPLNPFERSWKKPYQHNHDNPLLNFFYMLYLQMVNRTCSKPKSLEGAGFSPSFHYIWKSYENPMWDSSKTMSTYVD